MKAFETTATKMKSKGIPGLPPANPTSKPQQAKPEKKERKSQTTPTTDVEKSVPIKNLSLNDNKPNVNDAGETLAADPAKKIKALKKKLRDIEEISKKNVADLTPEQVEKLARKEALEQEILELEKST